MRFPFGFIPGVRRPLDEGWWGLRNLEGCSGGGGWRVLLPLFKGLLSSLCGWIWDWPPNPRRLGSACSPPLSGPLGPPHPGARPHTESPEARTPPHPVEGTPHTGVSSPRRDPLVFLAHLQLSSWSGPSHFLPPCPGHPGRRGPASPARLPGALAGPCSRS